MGAQFVHCCAGKHLERHDRAKVTFVQAEDAIRLVALSEHDQRAVGEAELEIRVARLELDHGLVVRSLNADQRV